MHPIFITYLRIGVNTSGHKQLYNAAKINRQVSKEPCRFVAQKEGFEPSRAFYTPTPLAGEPLRPLGYHSESKNNMRESVAERVGFEPTARCRVTGFQDRLLKPLGHLSTVVSRTACGMRVL